MVYEFHFENRMQFARINKIEKRTINCVMSSISRLITSTVWIFYFNEWTIIEAKYDFCHINKFIIRLFLDKVHTYEISFK